MKLIIRSAALLILHMALLVSVSYAADFSADMISKAKEGSFTAKLYVSGDKSRIEMPQGTTISRMDKKVVWVLMPQQKMYIEQPIDVRLTASMQEKIDGEIERKAIGNEKINNMDTTKYLVTFDSQGRQESIFQWINEATHIPVKTAAVDQSWSSEFNNIQSGALDQGLFEIPAGFQKMSFGLESMQGMMGSENR